LAVAIVDASPLYAAADKDDRDHQRCIAVLADPGFALVVPALVVAEATYLVAKRLGARSEAAFLRGLERLDVEAPASEDWARIGELVERYSDLRLGGTDASLIALAERVDARIVITLDHRHLSVVRPRHCDAFDLLPA